MRSDHPRHQSADAPEASPSAPAAALPSLPSSSRRRWLQRSMTVSLTSVAAGAVIGTGLGAAWLYHRRHTAAEAKAPLIAFMTVSQTLTGRPELDQEVAQRLFAALHSSIPDFSLRIQQLAAAMAAGQGAFSTFPIAAAETASLPNDPRQALASLILRGWYLGVVDGATVVDRRALMHTAVAQALPVRGYCGGAPGFWAAPPMES